MLMIEKVDATTRKIIYNPNNQKEDDEATRILTIVDRYKGELGTITKWNRNSYHMLISFPDLALASHFDIDTYRGHTIHQRGTKER